MNTWVYGTVPDRQAANLVSASVALNDEEITFLQERSFKLAF